jgi:branched-chain amino acid transport system substrate-binding protein
MVGKSLRAAALLPFLATSALAADSAKIGLITTLSGPEAVMGNPMRDGANLALSELGGKIGGLSAEIILGDDQQRVVWSGTSVELRSNLDLQARYLGV